VKTEIARFLLGVFGKLDLDSPCATTLVVLDSVTIFVALAHLFTGSAVRHAIVEFNFCIVIIDRNIDLTDGERLVTADLVAEIILLNIGLNAFAL